MEYIKRYIYIFSCYTYDYCEVTDGHRQKVNGDY